MGHANGIISSGSSGVSIEDVRQVIGIDDREDIGGLITAGVSRDLINKWAKYKPIHFPDKYELSDAQFRGRPNYESGLVYGLRVPAQISVISPSAFHGTTWAYEGYPNASGLSGRSPYRLTDFDGYYTNALPDIYGIIPSSSKFYVGTDDGGIVTANSVVNEGYRTNNQYGVTLARYVADCVGYEDDPNDPLMNRLAQCYPAILIGNYLTGVGVYNATTQGVDYNTIVRSNGSGGWVISNDSWCVDMRKTDENGNRPWTSTTSTVATLVLVYTARSDARLIANDQDSLLTQYWFDMSQQRGWTARIFPLPGACGVSISVEKYAVPGYTVTPREATSCTASEVTILFDVSFVGDSEPAMGGSANVSATVGGGGQAQQKTVFFRGGERTASATFTASNFGMAMFMPGNEYTMDMTIVATPPTGGNTTTGSVTFRRT